MRSLSLRLLALCGLWPAALLAQPVQISVDATELPRKLLRSTIELPAPGDSLTLWYPRWIPGIHGPRGPVQNVGGLVVRDARGETLDWQRNWADVYRFVVPTPQTDRVSVEMTYIASQPSTNSRGIDTYGYRTLGIISWNTALLYPDGVASDELVVQAKLTVPPGWGVGTALPVERRKGDTITFEPVSLTRLIDSPVVLGAHYRRFELATTLGATYYLDVVADEARDLPGAGTADADSVLAPLGDFALESEALFGREPHFDAYHFLLAVSDQAPRLGLEHRESSLNSAKADAFRNLDWTKNGLGYLLPHEFVHAYIGKYRRPAGMVTAAYHQPKNTEGLWVYEGLTQYLGNVLSVRSGLSTERAFRETMVRYTGLRLREQGRQWRPLRDTEVAAYTLRGGSESWALLRRGQSYYVEGALTWLDFDARLRERSGGKVSLDDFISGFFGGGRVDRVVEGFTHDEMIAALNRLDGGIEWARLIDEKIFRPMDQFSPDWVESSGHRLAYTDTIPASLKGLETRGKYVFLGESLGLTIKNDGEISSVTPGKPGDAAGLVPGTTVVGVNGWKFTPDRLRDAVKATTTTGQIELLTLGDERYVTYPIEYDGGARYWTIHPIQGRTDRLAEIAAPKRAGADTTPDGD